jgi:hypothetical protein
VQTPYTLSVLDAVMAAQTALGTTLTAAALHRPRRPALATATLIIAIWLPVLMPVLGDFLKQLSIAVPPTFDTNLLHASSVLAAVSMLAIPRRWLLLVVGLAAATVYRITDYIENSPGELASLHLILCGGLLGLEWAAMSSARLPAPGGEGPPVDLASRRFFVHDLALAAIAIGMGALVSTFVLERAIDSADEWGYTYQAALLAKGHAYGRLPRCDRAFQNFWVFWSEGRQFSQYTPGWPAFMVPFVWAKTIWLAGPFSFGLMVAGVARLTRRAFAAGGASRSVGAAGILAALSLIASSTMLINAGSRFPHIFMCALYAYALEAVCVVIAKDVPFPKQWRWGVILGLAAGFSVATRPGDAAFLNLGAFLVFVWAFVRRRVGWRAVVGAAFAFFAIAGITLVILRLQLGVWFKTGYSLTSEFHPWMQIAWSLPRPSEFKSSFALASGSYCWWPCAPALGMLGLAAIPARARHIAFMLIVSSAPLVLFYMASELGRNSDFGYGPRYQMHTIVPMAVGGGVALGYLWHEATSRFSSIAPLVRGGPMAVAIAAAIIGVVRIAPLVYPYNHQDVDNRNVVFHAAKAAGLHHAIVFIAPGVGMATNIDMTQNMPMELYENDVLYAVEYGPQESKCVKESHPGWRLYRAQGRTEITFVPVP